MNVQEAKLILMEKKPDMPFTAYAVEAAAMTGVAGVLVLLFA